MNDRGVASPDSDAAPSTERDDAPTRVDGRPPRLRPRPTEPTRRPTGPRATGADPAGASRPATLRKGTAGRADRTPIVTADRAADRTPIVTADRAADRTRDTADPAARPRGAAAPSAGTNDTAADPTGPRTVAAGSTTADDGGEAMAPAGRPRPAPAADRDPVAAVAERADPDEERPAPTEEAIAAARADFTPPGRLDVLGDPPLPPFEAAEAPYRWTVGLPSAVGRKVVVRIAEDVIDIGGTPVPIDDVVETTFRVQVEAALLRRAASARLSLTLVLDDGATVRMAARNAASSKGAGEIVDVAAYLWSLLGHTTQSDSPDAVIDRIQRGGDVAIARVHLSRIGISWKSDPIVRWSTIDDVARDGLHVVVRHADGEMRIPLTDTDAYVLMVLIPILRRRFS